MAALPEDRLRAVYEMNHSYPVAKVVEEYGYTPAEVTAICRIWKANVKASKEACQVLEAELAAKSKAYAPRRSITGTIVGE